MIEIKKEKISVDALVLGMFVVELDRPWIETPFMLQGMLLDDPSDIHTIMTLCKFVYIDRTKSAGNQFIPLLKQNISIKREGSVARVMNPSSIVSSSKVNVNTQEKYTKKTTFLEILRDLKSYKAPDNVESTNTAKIVYNVKHESSSVGQEALFNEHEQQTFNNKAFIKHGSIAKRLVNDVLNFSGGLIASLFSRDKLKTSINDITSGHKNSNDAQDDAYKLTIYEDELPVEIEIAEIFPIYEQSQIATREIFESVANNHDLNLSAVSDILDSMVESIGRSPDALLWLAKLKKTDDYSYNHAINVSITLMAFGSFLALSKQQIKELGLAGLLQDVGKVKISADILHKEGKLTREEFEHAKKHVDESLKIIEQTKDIPVSVVFLVAQHHERIDGSGYPNQLQGNQLGLISQISGLVDTYCAITSNKVYAKGVYHQQALDEIHHLAGTKFSVEIVDQLVQFMGMYPVSSLIELNTGEVAVVIQQNQVRRLLPRIMLLLDSDKLRYSAPIIMNLLLEPLTPRGELYAITKSLAPDSYGLNPNDFYV